MANQLQSKISILEENIITKGKQILDLENSLTKEHEQKLHLLEQSEQHCRNIQNLEKHLASNTEEINKSNEIIKRLQSEVKSFQTKVKSNYSLLSRCYYLPGRQTLVVSH
ncbi:unnamed protein product [Schistosoma curassoni]|uniref:Uncharacterized protein n=1 Tax=Schistosoma curassoni TaxID=6186 RepID=A0A183L2E3_9TREM|nr:unnamed protein product [Schistosoma curassoni]